MKQTTRWFPVLQAVCIVTLIWAAGCARIPYNPHLPTDMVGYRYTMYRYMNQTFSQTQSTHGNVRVTTTTFSRTTLGAQVLRYLDEPPHISNANRHIIAKFPGVLSVPFRSVDGSTADYKPQTGFEQNEEDAEDANGANDQGERL